MCKDSGVAKIDTALSMPKNEARALNSGNVVRLKCFGDTIAWTIYSIDNGMVAPDLKDFLDASEKYKRCVWSSGEKEYLISPPLDTPSV